MIPIAMGISSSILIGTELGKNNVYNAKIYYKASLLSSFLVILVKLFFFYFFWIDIPKIYTKDLNSMNAYYKICPIIAILMVFDDF